MRQAGGATMSGTLRALRGVLRDADDLCGLSVGDIADLTGIEVERLRELDAGVGAAPTPSEVALVLFGAIDRTLTQPDAEDPLLLKLRLLVDAQQPRAPRWLVLAALEKLLVDVERECREAAEGAEGEGL
jgi:hypothetical protein